MGSALRDPLHLNPRKRGRERAPRWRRPGSRRRDPERRAPLLIPAARARSPPTVPARRSARVAASSAARLSSADLAHVVHLTIDLAARGVEFLIVFRRRGHGFLRPIRPARARRARRSCAARSLKDRLEDQRVEQERAQQQEADDPERGDIRVNKRLSVSREIRVPGCLRCFRCQGGYRVPMRSSVLANRP